MNKFAATTESTAVVAAERSRIWAALTDPVLLPKLTPLLRRIDADGELWRWHMMSISALGVSIAPAFTERMHFVEGTEIRYTHEPPAGTVERTGAEGWYRLADVEGGTNLAITLTLHVELPLPRSAAPAVSRVMTGTMNRTGEKFAANLLRHLGIDNSATGEPTPAGR
ncbi:SRPBCC family protein [uncultured Jatrophihabitans sp.]|uniref:SRPBCC family protein n=1 Tax=uncultured Jatrophihabitans sp. TaxID=1610747 RepID=UPI0035CB78B0